MADELRDERDLIIQYRDSIKNVTGEGFNNLAKYNRQIKNLKDNSAIVFDDMPLKIANNTSATETDPEEEIIEETTEDIPVEVKKVKNNTTTAQDRKIKPQREINKPQTTNNDITSTEETSIPAETVVEKPVEEVVVAKVEPKIETPDKKAEEYTNFVRVEIPPTYPGCKGNAIEKKACFTKKVKNHLSRKFNTSVAEDYNLDSGRKRIWVSFDIDKFGNIVNVNARSPKEMSNNAKRALEKEATRVVKSLPKMMAARQNGNSVKIKYSVPITFIVQ